MSWKAHVITAAVGVAIAAGVDGSTVRAQTGHEGHAGMYHSMPSSAPAAAPASTAPGKMIRESKVQSASVTYRLYTWDERNVMMKGMEGHSMPGMDTSGKATNHLMVFFKGADGKELSGGKVGFIVTGPDKAEQKTLTMAMSGGYGADVNLKAKGAYTIKLKAVFGETTLAEEFVHTVQ